VAGSHPRKSRICIAKEAAMHAEHTAHAGSTVRADGTPPLTAIVPLARPTGPDAKSAPPKSLELPVTGTRHDERSLSVRYELDAVTHRWVASVMDDTTGEVVKTVPSTQVLHQLAALRHPALDLRA
jgi:FlaG protein